MPVDFIFFGVVFIYNFFNFSKTVNFFRRVVLGFSLGMICLSYFVGYFIFGSLSINLFALLGLFFLLFYFAYKKSFIKNLLSIFLILFLFYFVFKFNNDLLLVYSNKLYLSFILVIFVFSLSNHSSIMFNTIFSSLLFVFIDAFEVLNFVDFYQISFTVVFKGVIFVLLARVIFFVLKYLFKSGGYEKNKFNNYYVSSYDIV